jgi:hypothetical protein
MLAWIFTSNYQTANYVNMNVHVNLRECGNVGVDMRAILRLP